MAIETDFPHVDERGKRYRKLGSSIEYAPELSRAHCVNLTPEPKPSRKFCPFMGECLDGACAFYDGGRCNPHAPRQGGRCPLRERTVQPCGDRCALFNSGACGLFKKG